MTQYNKAEVLLNALAGRIHLDFRADDPIYLQIVRQIEALVAGGALQPGDQLPTVRELAIDLRINFSTVARAYRILDEQRLISTQRGRGTYIWEESEPGTAQASPGTALAPPGRAQEKERAGSSSEALSGLAGRFIREAAETGASPEQIEQAFQQQLNHWKSNFAHSGS